jgi:hypothetical protein
MVSITTHLQELNRLAIFLPVVIELELVDNTKDQTIPI